MTISGIKTSFSHHLHHPPFHFSKKFSPLVQKIQHIVIKIFKGALLTICFYINPQLFAAGFFIGAFVCGKQINLIAKNISETWKSYNLVQKFITLFAGLFFSLPVAIPASVFLISAYFGSTQRAQKPEPSPTPPKPSTPPATPV